MLFLAGLGVFYRIPVVIAKIKMIDQFSGSGIYFAYFCFYFIGVILIGGGIKKILHNFRDINRDMGDRQG